MNRQIIPSMILSVLIVCFFSIVLYERDKPGAVARPSGGDPAPAATSASASQNVDKPAATSPAASKGPDSSKVVDEGPPREIKGLVKTETPSASHCRSACSEFSCRGRGEGRAGSRCRGACCSGGDGPRWPWLCPESGGDSLGGSGKPCQRKAGKPRRRLLADKYRAPVGVHHGEGWRDVGRRDRPHLRLVRPARPALAGQPGSPAPQEFSAERGCRTPYARRMIGPHPLIAGPRSPGIAPVTFRQRCGSR